MAIAVASGDPSVGEEVQQGRRHELEPGLVLRQVDVHTAAGPAAGQRSQDRDGADSDGDEVDVRPIEYVRRLVGIAEQLGKAAQRGQVAAKARMAGVGAVLALVTG